MIRIYLKLFVTLAKFIPDNSEEYKIKKGSTIKDLIDELSIPVEMAKLTFINGKRQSLDYILKENDRVGIFPPVGGG